MRNGLLLFLFLATAVPLRICGADEKPARPIPAVQKKAAPVPLRVFPPRPGLRNRVDPQPQQPATGLVLADRKLVVRLRRARAALAAQKFTEAIGALQSLLDDPEDSAFFIDSEKRSGLRSIKLEAEHLLGTMPPAGRKVYELQYGLPAQQMLEAAVEVGDIAKLAESRDGISTPGRASKQPIYWGPLIWITGNLWSQRFASNVCAKAPPTDIVGTACCV